MELLFEERKRNKEKNKQTIIKESFYGPAVQLRSFATVKKLITSAKNL